MRRYLDTLIVRAAETIDGPGGVSRDSSTVVSSSLRPGAEVAPDSFETFGTEVANESALPDSSPYVSDRSSTLQVETYRSSEGERVERLVPSARAVPDAVAEEVEHRKARSPGAPDTPDASPNLNEHGVAESEESADPRPDLNPAQHLDVSAPTYTVRSAASYEVDRESDTPRSAPGDRELAYDHDKQHDAEARNDDDARVELIEAAAADSLFVLPQPDERSDFSPAIVIPAPTADSPVAPVTAFRKTNIVEPMHPAPVATPEWPLSSDHDDAPRLVIGSLHVELLPERRDAPSRRQRRHSRRRIASAGAATRTHQPMRLLNKLRFGLREI